MSHEGKLKRGVKWFSKRDSDGILPKEISEDENKMKDANYYLEYVKNKDKEKEETEEPKTKSKRKK